MIDDAFRLTPLDVRRYEFGTTMRGYDKARVDEFREQVAEELDRLSRANSELGAQVQGLADQLRGFREREKALNDALVSAQQLRAEMREQAEKEKELIIREAKSEADRIGEQARSDIRNIGAEMEGLERSRRAYLAQLKALTERQLAEIEAVYSVSFAPREGTPSEGTPTATSRPTPAWLNSLAEE